MQPQDVQCRLRMPAPARTTQTTTGTWSEVTGVFWQHVLRWPYWMQVDGHVKFFCLLPYALILRSIIIFAVDMIVDQRSNKGMLLYCPLKFLRRRFRIRHWENSETCETIWMGFACFCQLVVAFLALDCGWSSWNTGMREDLH